MHLFVTPGQSVFVILTSGSLSCTQSIVTLLRREFDRGDGLATVPSFYEASRVVGAAVREVASVDRESLERDGMKFNANILLGGQIRGEDPGLVMIYPQGNPLAATEDCPYLQIGETKYGRPILDRGIRFHKTTLAEAAKYALLSLDSTMKSNVTVGPPIDVCSYDRDTLDITNYRRFTSDEPELNQIRTRWERTLRTGIRKLPEISLRPRPRDERFLPERLREPLPELQQELSNGEHDEHTD
jgi:putative proteasome-type protease